MELADLRVFLVLAQRANLRIAAGELQLTPSALSKCLGRLERALGTRLFDRHGRALRLNAAGSRLRELALDLVRRADQLRETFLGVEASVRCRIAAPALLHWRHGNAMAARLLSRHREASFVFLPLAELDALEALLRRDADLAVVTVAALDPLRRQGRLAALRVVELGSTSFQIAAGRTHPLLHRVADPRSSAISEVEVPMASVLEHDFASPTRSLICNEPREARSDGWNEDRYPRRIRYWCDDIAVLLALVRSGRALAYLPEFAFADSDLVRIVASDCPYACIERVVAVYEPAAAPGWLTWLADTMA